MYLNVELELALVAIQKCLVILHDYLGPNTKKLWLHTHTHITLEPARSALQKNGNNWPACKGYKYYVETKDNYDYRERKH